MPVVGAQTPLSPEPCNESLLFPHITLTVVSELLKLLSTVTPSLAIPVNHSSSLAQPSR